jgi:hypothetical protein
VRWSKKEKMMKKKKKHRACWKSGLVVEGHLKKSSAF